MLTYQELASPRRGERAGRAGFASFAVSCLPIVPVVLAACAQVYASHARLPWVTIAWRARHIAMYWSFAFWEWVACALYTLFLLRLLAVGGRSP